MSIRTPEAILSFPNLLVPRAMKNEDGSPAGKEKYSASLIFLPNTPAKFVNVGTMIDLAELRQAATEVAREKFGSKLESLVKSGKFKSPFRTDGEQWGYPEGHVFIRATSLQKPGVVSRYRGPDGQAQTLTDEEVAELLWSGAIVRATLRPFAYDTAGNKGVSFALNNIQLLGHGERLDGRKRAADEFEGLDDAADLDSPETAEDDADVEVAPPVKTKTAKTKASEPAEPPAKRNLTVDSLL